MPRGGKTIPKRFLTIHGATEAETMACRSLNKLPALLAAFLATAVAQQPKAVLPMVAGGAMPLYPPLARAAKVQGVVQPQNRNGRNQDGCSS